MTWSSALRCSVLVVSVVVGAAGCSSPTPGPTPAPLPAPETGAPSAGVVPCPVSGVRVAPGVVDAASGFRAVTLTLTVCGADPVAVEGYPEVDLLDGGGAVLEVTEVRGGTSFPDPGPVPLDLPPGGEATAVMSWRSTVTDGTPVEAEQVRLAPAAGVEPQTSELFVDLGTTGTYELTAWAPSPA